MSIKNIKIIEGYVKESYVSLDIRELCLDDETFRSLFEEFEGDKVRVTIERIGGE